MENIKNLCTRGFFMPLLALILCMGRASTPAVAADVGGTDPTTSTATVGSDDSYVDGETDEDSDADTPEGDDETDVDTTEPTEGDGETGENVTTEPSEGGDETDGNDTTAPTEGEDGDETDVPECTCGAEGDTHDENCPQHKAPEVDPAVHYHIGGSKT